ncbi:MAG: hypothetical protein ACUVX8_09105 [Candidatus Zipacnadales bacterium]
MQDEATTATSANSVCGIVDIDNEGEEKVVICDCAIVDSKVAILKGVDDKGTRWEREGVPQGFP